MKIARGISFFFSTIAIYLGLPLLGWGLDDFSGFFSLQQRLCYSMIIVILGLLVGFQAVETPEGIRGGRGQEGKLLPRQRIIRILVSSLLFFGLIFIPYTDRRSIGVIASSQTARWFGLVLFMFGIGLVFWSGLALGRLYSPDVTIQEEHRLITNGPYRFIRHPRYLGGILLGIGLSLLFRSWIGLFLTSIFIVVLCSRIRDEEIIMSEEFGEEWETYCNSHGV
jgi:protein-S-isoprenylcysteine O-methyltransferase Ste14